MKDIAKRFTSRKFLLAVAAFCTALANGEVLGAIAVAVGYIGIEGASDYVKASK